MGYKVSFELEFTWNEEEAELAEFLLLRRYKLQHLKYNRLSAGIARAALDVIAEEAMKTAVEWYRRFLKGELDEMA